MEEEEEVVITNQPLNPEETWNTLEEEKVEEVVNEEDDEEKVEEIDIWDLIDNEEGEVTQESLQGAYNEIQQAEYDKLSNNPFARTEPLQVGAISVPPVQDMWWSEERQRWNVDYLDEENKAKATQINEYLDRREKEVQESQEAWKQYIKVAEPGEVIISKDGTKEYKYNLMDNGRFQYNYRTPGSEDWQNFEFNEDGTTTDPEFINALVAFEHGEVKETPKQRRLAPNQSNLRAKQYQFMNWKPDESIDIDYFNRLGGKTKSNQRLKEEGDTSFEKKWETKKEGFELSKEYLEAKIIDEDLDITYPYLNYYIDPANTETEIDEVIDKYYPDIRNLALSPFQVFDNDNKPLRSQEDIDMEVKNFAGFLDKMDAADQIVLLSSLVENPTLWSQKEAPDSLETLLDRAWDIAKDNISMGLMTNPVSGFIEEGFGGMLDAYNIAITKPDDKTWNKHLLESIGELWKDHREAPEVLLQGELNKYLQNYKADADTRLNELNVIQGIIADEEIDLSKQLINEQTSTSYVVPFGADNRPNVVPERITETITTIDTPDEFFNKKLGELTMPYTNWDGEQGLKYEQINFPELYAKQERYENDKLIRQKRQSNNVTSIMDGLVFGAIGFGNEFKYAVEDIGIWASGIAASVLPEDSYLDNEYKKSIMQFDENRRWERAKSDTGLYGIITGKSYTDDKGVEYIMDERGIIYDTDSKFVVDTSMEGYESIRKNLLNSNTRGSSFSSRGAFETTTKVFGNLAVQIYLTKGMGLLTAPMRASLLTSINGFKNVKQFKFAESLAKSIGNKNLNGLKKLPIKQSTLDAIATQGMFFSSVGYNDIRRQAVGSGISLDEAEALAQKGSLMYGVIGMVTAPLAPLARNNQSATAEFITNNTIRKLVLDYGETNSKTAFSRFGNRLKNTLWKWRNNPKNVSMFSEGRKEIGQEVTSESAIVYGVNPWLNEQLDASIFQENMTLQEGLNLSLVSGIAGGLGARITNPVDYDSNPSTLQALYMAGKDNNYQVTKSQLEKLVLGKVITVDEMETILRDMDVVRSEGAKTQSWISAENQLPVLRLNYKIRNLQNRKKNLKLVGTEAEVIDNQINDLIEEKNNLLKPDVLKKWGNIIEGSEAISQDLEQDFYEGDQTGIENEINKILEENPEADVDRENEKDYGVFVTIPAKDGKPERTITLVNRDTSLKDTIFTTGQHEVFHGLLDAFRKKFALELSEWKKGGKKGDAPENPITKLGLSLLNELKNNENVIFKDTTSGRSLQARIEDYLGDKSKSLDTVIEEIMPLLSEALTDGGVEIKQDAWGKIGDFFRRFFQYFGKKIKFKEGVDVINLVRDYNKAIESKKGIKRNKFFDIITLGQLPETGLQRFGKGEADINLDVDIEAGKTELQESRDQILDEDPFGEKSDSKSSKKINEVDLQINESEFKQNMRKYNEDKLSVDLIDDIYTPYLKAGMSSLKRIGASESKVKGTQIFDLRDPVVFKEVESALSTEFQSFLDNYNPELSDPTTYSDFMALRILPDIVDLLAKKGKSLDTMKAEKGFDVEGDSQVDFDASSRKSTARKKKYASSIPAIKNQITENIGIDLVGGVDIDGRVTGLAKDIIGNIGRNTDPETVAKDIIKNTKAKEVMVPFRELVGKWGSREYNDFVDQIINQGLISTIPSSTIKRRLGFQRNVDAGLLDYKKTGKTKQIKVKNGKKTYSQPDVFEITRIDKTKLKEYYKDNEKRQQSLFSMIAESILAEGVQTLRNDKQFMDRLRTTLELKNSPLSTNEFMDGLEQKLDQRTKEDTSLDNISIRSSRKITTADKQRIGILTRDRLNTRQYWKKQLGKDYMLGKPGDNKDKTSWTEEDYEKRDFNTLNFIPELGLGFVSIQSVTGNTKTMFYRKLEAGRDDLQELLDNDLPTKFVEQSFTEDGSLIPDSYIDKGLKAKKPYIEEVDGKYRFIKKNLPEYGSVFTKRDVEVLKQAALDQKAYVNWSEEKFNEKLNDPNFRAQEQDKLTVFKKLLEYIESQVWKSGDFDPEVFGFWASWMASQAAVSDHPVRALSPILFYSISGVPLKSRLYDEETGLPVVKSTKLTLEDGTIKLEPVFKSTQKGGSLPDWVMVNNYVAEHAFQANNGSKIALDAIRNKNVKKQWKFIADHYGQGQLLKTDDDLVNLLFKEKLPNEFFDMDNPNIWVRYLLGNPNINLNEYMMWSDTKKKVVTIAEELGLSLAKKDQNPNSIALQNRLLLERLGIYQYQEETYIDEPRSVASVKAELKSALNVDSKSSKQVNNNKKTLFNLITSNSTTEASIEAMKNADTAIKKGNLIDKPTKGISVFDFDDTLAFSDSKVIVELNDGTIKKITPAEFAATAEQLLENGAEFNFDEFNKVVNGRKGPLADLALKRQAKFGSGDIFVLTARPQLSAQAIKLFLDGIGLDIPLKNITGLENGSPEAKALWMVDKAAQGYNDFYFADDALPNVQAVENVLSQIDVKSKVQQALSSKKIDLDREFNEIIEQQTGKEWFKKYSDARAKVEGRKANRFEFFIPPSAEDFLGLTYRFLPKGENGNRALQWVTDNLLDPFNQGEQAVISAKMTVANDFKSLRDSLENIPDNLMDESGYSNFSWSQALRVYIWDMQGMDIPGLSKRDLNRLKKVIEDNVDMKVFAEKIAFIQKGKQYPAPGDNWVSGSITSDIIDSIQKVYRKEALAKWQQNVDIIFSKQNMNKLEALYGSNYTIALKNILGRMKRGSNRPISDNPQVDNVMDWINNSVGTTMFLNRKSALLQLISNVNFINWSDNNILEAGKAFANQKQYWKDVMYLLNSDYLVQRRNGLKINVAESEIAEAAKRGGFKGAIAYLLNKGFVFTRFADSLAIATGGATFYRNRVNRLLKTVNIDTGKLYTKAEADRKAFNDFYKISEETQQSSRTDRISMQQSSGLGRIVLNYANTPMQYARIIKRSTQDLLAGRGDWRTNISRILYYGAIQNLIFNALQQALFSLAFAEDDEPEKQDRTTKDKAKNIGYGMLSTLLRGLGYGGALVDTLISISREIKMGDDGLPIISEDAVYNIADFSPSIDSKVRKFRSVQKTFKFNRKEILRRGFNLDNPAYLAFGQVIDAAFNVPLDQALRMVMSIKQASDRDTELWQRFALLAGWSSWSIGLPYWGTTTTVGNEAKEDDEIKSKYKNDARKLKGMGYKRIPMTKGKPKGELMEDYIEVTRPTGDTEYWLTPKK